MLSLRKDRPRIYMVADTSQSAATVNPTWANGSGMGHTDAAIAAFKAQ